jgi:hypothetical protein
MICNARLAVRSPVRMSVRCAAPVHGTRFDKRLLRHHIQIMRIKGYCRISRSDLDYRSV